MERRCIRCGITSEEANRQNEPICNDDGLVAGHCFRDTVSTETELSQLERAKRDEFFADVRARG